MNDRRGQWFVRIAVTVVVPLVSGIVSLPTSKVTVGGISPSTIMTVCVCVPNSSPLFTAIISIISDSSISSNGLSSLARSVTSAEIVMTGIAIVVLSK
jgi:hypothetical protein